MIGGLNQFVSNATPCAPSLPLTHTCDSYSFRAIIESSQISTAHCKVFKETLVYFFYGRPAYRPSSWNRKIRRSNLAFLPCSIVLRANAISKPKRVAPFDTGAFKRGLYDDFLHKDMEMEDFLLEPSMKMPPLVVGKFYESNVNYYYGRPAMVSIPPVEFEVQSYYDIISHGSAYADDRGSAIEIQSDQLLTLTSNNVIFVVLPRVFLDENLIQETVLKNWRVVPGLYETYQGDPKEFMSTVYKEIATFLRNEGLL